MGKEGVGKEGNGDKVAKALEAQDAGLFDGKLAFQVLKEGLDRPAVEVGVGGGEGGSAEVLGGGVGGKEVECVEEKGGATEGAGNEKDGKMGAAILKIALAIMELCGYFTALGAEGRGEGGGFAHNFMEGAIGGEKVAGEGFEADDGAVAETVGVGEGGETVEAAVCHQDAFVAEGVVQFFEEFAFLLRKAFSPGIEVETKRDGAPSVDEPGGEDVIAHGFDFARTVPPHCHALDPVATVGFGDIRGIDGDDAVTLRQGAGFLP